MASHTIFSVTPRLQCLSLPCDRTIKPPFGQPIVTISVCPNVHLLEVSMRNRVHIHRAILHTSDSHNPFSLYLCSIPPLSRQCLMYADYCSPTGPQLSTASASLPREMEGINLGREGPDLEIVEPGAILQGYRYSLTYASHTNPAVWPCLSFAFTNPAAPEVTTSIGATLSHAQTFTGLTDAEH